VAYNSGLRLPEDIERGAKGGPGYKTTVLPLSGGREKRNIEWSRSRGKWDVGYGLQSKTLLVTIIDFFHSMEGRAHSFPFKDWSDYEIGVDATDTYQEVGIGDGAEQNFQIVRRYTTGGVTKDRIIEKPRATVRVFLGAAEQFSGFTVNASTGIINFTSPPGGAVSVGVICEFDCPVRFDTDDLSVVMEVYNAGMIPSIPLIEVRGES
jgi:uncharacterized protein (TIGR02217 family)